MTKIYDPKIRALPERYRPGFLQKIDARTALAVGLNTSFQRIVDDMGGLAALSHLQLALVERAVFLEFRLRQFEAAMLAGTADPEDTGRWVQATNAYMGVARTLGLKRAGMANAIDALYSRADEPQETPTKRPTMPAVASKPPNGKRTRTISARVREAARRADAEEDQEDMQDD